MIDSAFLQRIAIFARLEPEDRERVAAAIHERRYRRGAIIFGEGEPGDAVFFVRSGRVKVYRVAPDGREQILGIWGPGAPFGLVTALDGQPYPANAEALEDTTAWMIRTDDFQRLLAELSALSGLAMRTVGGRLRGAHDRVHALSAQGAHQRLATYLLEQARTHGTPVTGGVLLDLPLTHQELGGLLGTARETVTRAFADFRRTGGVQVQDSGKLLIHPDKLGRWLAE